MDPLGSLASLQQKLKKYTDTPPALLAVSKSQPVEKIKLLYQQGQRSFGENYVQELVEKSAQLHDCDICWHFIGKIQTNKLRKIAAVAQVIQSVESTRQLDKLHSILLQLEKQIQVYLLVNACDEPNKSGCKLSDVMTLANHALSYSGTMQLMGIMAIPPKNYHDEAYHQPPAIYHQLREVADTVGCGELSLGMSSDIRLALQVGTNQVRIGTALFGKRPPATTD